MGRAPRRPGLDALAAVALAVTALVAVSAPVASASWSRPVRFGGPSSLDVSPAQIGLSPSGAAAIAFGLENAESPASASAVDAQLVLENVSNLLPELSETDRVRVMAPYRTLQDRLAAHK